MFNLSPQAFKFYMEQHIENVMKSCEERENRRLQLEKEMKKIGLSEKDQNQMRKMLSQKESNFIRLKRAKMGKHLFRKIKTIGEFAAAGTEQGVSRWSDLYPGCICVCEGKGLH